MHEPATFGEWVGQRRRALHLTQEALAEQLYCALGTLRKIESDERRPSRELAERLAEVLEVPPEHQATFVSVARADLALDRLAISPDPATAPRRLKPTQPPTNLRLPRTSFVGRESAWAQVQTLLLRSDVGLLTLTGPGGIGTTRLAQEVAAVLRDHFADGVWFVDLAPFNDHGLVVPAIAQVLGVREVGGQPLIDSLTSYLRDRHLLLVLDNFEQVVGAAMEVGTLLVSARQLTVLVTSRVVLHLSGEHEYTVSPLMLPDDTQPLVPEQVNASEAVRLFVARAQAVNAGFTVTPENAGAVAEICSRMDGLPLAIELAAARSKLFSPRVLLERLGSGLTFLTGGARDLPARQQTMRNTIEWSYELLDDGEKTLFARLGVFSGGWTLAAVGPVCNPAGDLPIDTLDGVVALVDKSLLRQTETGDGEPRFSMFETIREYAWERLEASGEGATIPRQHAEYFLCLAVTAEAHLIGPQQMMWLQHLEDEHDNLQAALHWALGGEGRPAANVELGAQLAVHMGAFWDRRGNGRETLRWLERVVEQSQEAETIPVAVRACALLWLCRVTSGMLGNLVTGRAYVEESLALFREVGDRQGIAQALVALGLTVRAQGEAGAGKVYIEESLALFREIGDTYGIATTLPFVAGNTFAEGDTAGGQALLEEGLAIFRELGDLQGIAHMGAALADVAESQQDVVGARRQYEESLALYRTLGNKEMIATVLSNFGQMLLKQGQTADAWRLLEESESMMRDMGARWDRAYFQLNVGLTGLAVGDVVQANIRLRESLALFHEMASNEGITRVLEGLAAASVAQEPPIGDARRAARLFAAAAVQREQHDILPWGPIEGPAVERGLAAARASLDQATWDAAWAEGRTMTQQQAIAYALEEGKIPEQEDGSEF